MGWQRWAFAMAVTIPLMTSAVIGRADAGLLGAVTDTTTAVTNTVTSTTSTVTNTVTGTLSATTAAVAGTAPDAVLYETTEAVGGKGSGQNKNFKSSTATLSGVARAGTVLCPPSIASTALQGCWITVRATGRADDMSGIGPVAGTMEVLIQDKNLYDSPEITVLSGTISGNIDLSPAFVQGRPLGSITGMFSVKSASGSPMNPGTPITGLFSGTFRLPFGINGQAVYMRDDGSTFPADPAEYVLGYPGVRLEIKIK